MIKLKLGFLLVALFICQNLVIGQQSFVFKFKAESDFFYEKFIDNSKSISQLLIYIDENKKTIQQNSLPIKVIAFYDQNSLREQELASIRAKRVKSEMITRRDLNESNFKTEIQESKKANELNTVIVELSPLSLQASLINTSKEADSIVDVPVSKELVKETEPVLEEKYSQDLLPEILRIKNNLAFSALGVFNLGGEFLFHEHFSVDLSFFYSPYTISKSYQLRVLALQPEFRYWFKPLHTGHFVGTHFTLAWYNLALGNTNRYQDKDGNSPTWGAGLSYGYVLPLGKKWGMELTAGLGYLRLNYDKFYNVDNGAKIESKSYHYFGPTKLGVSLIYRINR